MSSKDRLGGDVFGEDWPHVAPCYERKMAHQAPAGPQTRHVPAVDRATAEAEALRLLIEATRAAVERVRRRG